MARLKQTRRLESKRDKRLHRLMQKRQALEREEEILKVFGHKKQRGKVNAMPHNHQDHMATTTETPEPFPIGGPREPVYDALRSRGFAMVPFGDKHWTRRGGLEVHIYGTGSRLRVHRRGKLICDSKMAESLAFIDNLDKEIANGSND